MAHENRIHPFCFPWNPVTQIRAGMGLSWQDTNIHEALGLFPTTTKMGHDEACMQPQPQEADEEKSEVQGYPQPSS